MTAHLGTHEVGDLLARSEQVDKLALDILPGGGSNQQISQLVIIGGQKLSSVPNVVVEHLPGKKEGGPFARFAEGLGPSDPEGDYGGSLNWVVDWIDSGKGSSKSIQVIGIVEPIIDVSYLVADGHCQVDRRSVQWS
jgi:hypothetical protein